jgi:hypothetical protein
MGAFGSPRARRCTKAVGTVTRLFLGCAISYLVACGPGTPSITPVIGPEGQYGWLSIRCPHDRAKCRELASQACPKGYDIVDTRGNQDRYTSPDTMSEPIGTPGNNGEMLVGCK